MNTLNVKDASGNTIAVPTLPANDGTSLPISAAALPLPAGAATDAKVEAVRALLAGAATQATLAALLTALGTPLQAGGNVAVTALPATAAKGADVAAVVTALQALLKVDTVVQATATDRGASVGTAASTLMAANAARRGFAVQNQSSTAKIYINGTGAATADYHSLMVPPLGYYETPPGHTGTGAISIISDTAATSVYAREW